MCLLPQWLRDILTAVWNIARRARRAFWERHPDTEQPLRGPSPIWLLLNLCLAYAAVVSLFTTRFSTTDITIGAAAIILTALFLVRKRTRGRP
jgi:hypothetical protein